MASTAPDTQEWYQISSRDGSALGVHFCHRAADWIPPVLQERPLPPAECGCGREVSLDGKAPMWMYAHVAAWAVGGRAARVWVCQPQRDGPVEVWPLPSGGVAATGWCAVRRVPDGALVVEFLAGERREVDVLKGLAGLVGDCRGACVIITGSGAAWMYAGVAALAAGGGAATVACLSPRDASAGLIVVYGQETPPGSRLAIPAGVLPELSEPGQVIGIVGDPNSGKSVLAKLCLHALRQAGSRDCWCLDCDAASPTPNWYVDMTQAGAALRAKDLRDKQKRPWNREMELAVAEQLRSCRGMLRLVIADLPGGRHRGDVKQRIPPGRDVIMREVDRFIVIGREGAPEVIEGWRRDLEKHGLADRIVAELRSAAPGAAFSLALDAEPCGGVLRGRVTGLDRGNASAGASAEFLAALRELLRHAGAV